MTGAIIGDLAAWTWENDKEVFYNLLVSGNARLSECGLCMLTVFATGRNQYDFPLFQKEFNAMILAHRKDVSCSQEWSRFMDSGCKVFNEKVLDRIYAACLVLAGWQPDSGEMATSLAESLGMDKKGFYASSFANVISKLGEGCPKKHIVNYMADGDKRLQFILRWHENHGSQDIDLLGHLNYAWRCFQYSWDFTSAIHEAMRCPDCFDRHLVGMLTGAIAEAMYGCTFRFLKNKYCAHQSPSEDINLPKSVRQQFTGTLKEIQRYEEEHRHFFKKNDAMTNVERHIWVPFSVEGIPMELSAEYYRRMLKAYVTGWDCRFGVYLDDGWFYVYRSWFLLARFKLTPLMNEQWQITDLQRCADDKHDPYEAMRSLLYSIIESWYDISGERRAAYPSYCKYYKGEEECPYEYRSTKGKFWYGEKMFVMGELDIEEWKRKADELLPQLTGNAMTVYRNMEPEQRALALYIETLFSKWCPYDDMEWIFEYGLN